MQDRGLFSESFIQQPSVFRRLAAEGAEAWRELRQDPARYLVAALKGDGIGGRRRQERLMYGMAIALVIIGAGLVFILWQDSRTRTQAEEGPENWQLIAILRPEALTPQEVDAPKKAKKMGGGGGGGQQTPTPPSEGQTPKFMSNPPSPPTPTPPVPDPPLPKPPEAIDVNLPQPRRDIHLADGLKVGQDFPGSAGPGRDGGLGSGSGGGAGPGAGDGLGPGQNGGIGGGDRREGGGDRDTPVRDVDSRPVLLSRIRPNYTEEARKNKVQGTVRVRITIGPDGAVKRVQHVSGLPNGLTEEAIRAAYQLRFKAAIKNGQPVAYVLPVDIEFNLR